MVDNKTDVPECFGQLDTVFPLGEEGIRTSPPQCMRCSHAKSCLQAAMGGPEGLKLKEEKVDQAYEYGLIGKLERWSKKKLIRREIETMTSMRKSRQKNKNH
ncbi:MAG TPA: hypothetical protein EYP19_00485 [Desulfobacterales bacterium]|jgi:hypothetical protein|nr:hypothetical protein [Desulfobacterales bacterium]